MKVKLKPAVMEAVRFAGFRGDRTFFDNYGGTTRPSWLVEALSKPQGELGSLFVGAFGKLVIATMGGWDTVDMGDWIIRDERGDLKSCKPELFAAQYEEAA